MSKDQAKGKKPDQFIIDSEKDAKHAQQLEKFIKEIAGQDVDKVVVLTIDKEGDVRPIFTDPKGKCEKAAEKIADAGTMMSQQTKMMNMPEHKEIVKQNLMSLTVTKPNPYYFCYTNGDGELVCIWI